MDQTLNKEVKEVVIEQVEKTVGEFSTRKKSIFFTKIKVKSNHTNPAVHKPFLSENFISQKVQEIGSKKVEVTSFSKSYLNLSGGETPISLPMEKMAPMTRIKGTLSKIKNFFFRKKVVESIPTVDKNTLSSVSQIPTLKEKIIIKVEQFDDFLGVSLGLIVHHLRLFQNDPFLYIWTYPAHAAIAYSLGLWFLTWLSSYSSVDRRQSIIELKKEKTHNREVRIASKPLPLEINISEETGEAIVSFQSLPSESTVSKEIMESGKGMVRFEPTNFPIAIPDESTLARSSFLFVGANSHSQSSPGIFSRIWQVFFPTNSPLTIYATQDQKALIQVGDRRVEDQKQSCSELTKEIRDNCQVKQDNVRLTVEKECTSHVANNVTVAQKQLEKQCKQQIVEKASSYCAKSKKTLDGLETLLESESCSTNATACLNDVKKIVADKGEGNLLDNLLNWML